MREIHDFKTKKEFSEGVINTSVLNELVSNVAAATGHKPASRESDKHGTDFWIERKHGLPPLSVDMKNRDYCPIERFGTDDVCIETTSVYVGPWKAPYEDKYRQAIGWTLNEKKRTDYIVYTWPSGDDKRRYWVVPFPFLCIATQRHWKEWAHTLKRGEVPVPNHGYVTLCVFPLRKIVVECMRPLFANQVIATSVDNGTWQVC